MGTVHHHFLRLKLKPTRVRFGYTWQTPLPIHQLSLSAFLITTLCSIGDPTADSKCPAQLKRIGTYCLEIESWILSLHRMNDEEHAAEAKVVIKKGELELGACAPEQAPADGHGHKSKVPTSVKLSKLMSQNWTSTMKR